VYGFALSRIGANSFLPSLSIDVVAMTVIGGIGIIAGPILGAFYIFGVPDFVPLDAVTTAAPAAGGRARGRSARVPNNRRRWRG